MGSSTTFRGAAIASTCLADRVRSNRIWESKPSNGIPLRPMAKPTHTLFHVIEGKDGKDNFWLKIGAGWEHKDGDGISLHFEVFPTKTGRVTLRRMKDDEG